MVRALSKSTGIEENLLAHRLMGNWNPSTTSYYDLVEASTTTDDDSKPYPFYLAYPIEGEIEDSISRFYSIIDEFFEEKLKLFDIDNQAYRIFKDVRSSSIIAYLNAGLKAFHKNNENKIEETLFFYPLIGMLHNLAVELSENRT